MGRVLTYKAATAPVTVQSVVYASIPDDARRSFDAASAAVGRLNRTFSGNFTTEEKLRAIPKQLVEIERLCRQTRGAL